MCKRYFHRLSLTPPPLGTQPTTQACALPRNRTGDLSVCRLVLNPLSHTSRNFLLKKCIKKVLLIKKQVNQHPHNLENDVILLNRCWWYCHLIWALGRNAT